MRLAWIAGAGPGADGDVMAMAVTVAIAAAPPNSSTTAARAAIVRVMQVGRTGPGYGSRDMPGAQAS